MSFCRNRLETIAYSVPFSEKISIRNQLIIQNNKFTSELRRMGLCIHTWRIDGMVFREGRGFRFFLMLLFNQILHFHCLFLIRTRIQIALALMLLHQVCVTIIRHLRRRSLLDRSVCTSFRSIRFYTPFFDFFSLKLRLVKESISGELKKSAKIIYKLFKSISQ